MMHLIIAVVLVISGCFFGSVIDFTEQDISGKENELYNSGFEEMGSDPLPLGWMVLNDGEDSISVDRESFHSGQQSLKISQPKKKVSLISESFPLDEDGVYFSRCFLKTNYESNHAVEIMLVAFDAHGRKLNQFKQKVLPQENWTKAALKTGFFKQNARFGRIIITFPSRTDKVFWLDDVETYNVYELHK